MAIADSSLPRVGNALILRAIPTLLAAVVITFSRNHAAVVGLSVFVGFAFLLASTLMFTIMSVPLEGLNRTLVGIQSITTVVAAAVAAAAGHGGVWRRVGAGAGGGVEADALQMLGQRHHNGCLAHAAEQHIAHHHDRHRQAMAGQQACVIQRSAIRHSDAQQQRQRTSLPKPYSLPRLTKGSVVWHA